MLKGICPGAFIFHYTVGMSETLLRTKFHIPSPRLTHVSRPHLILHLNQGLQLGHGLFLISAPAGFGKTTLVAEWAQELKLTIEDLRETKDEIRNTKYEVRDNKKLRGRAKDSPIVNHQSKIANHLVWLSLDEGDNDPARFLSYFTAALSRGEDKIGNGARRMLQSPQLPVAEDVLTSLINDIALLSEKIIVVLDDYHVVESEEVHRALAFLLDHLPPQLHLVIVTREDPQLPIARFRARGKLTELRGLDLRFTLSEIEEFFNRAIALNLSEAEIAVLETRTEGWIAGLQLAAIAIQGSRDSSTLIGSFTGSHRFVLDYLVEEVLDQQPKEIQTFLLKTAVLGRMTGQLCDALTGWDNGEEILERLDHDNLFVVPLDEERHWYRYHHLFSDLLRLRLSQTRADDLSKLHLRASEWFEQLGHVDEAIDHALRAENFERAAALLERRADVLWQRGEHVKLRKWLAKLPDELVCSRPELCIFDAWYLFASGQHDVAEETLKAAEQAFQSITDCGTLTALVEVDPTTHAEEARLCGRVAAIRAFMDSYRGDVAGIIRHANRALVCLPEGDRTWRSITEIVSGDAYGFKGDLSAAYRSRMDAYQNCLAAGDTYYAILAGIKVAITLRSQGHLQQTIETCQDVIRLADECGLSSTSVTGLAYALKGEVLAELNEMDEAFIHARKGIRLVTRGIDLTLSGWGYLCLMRIYFSSKDAAGIRAIRQKMENLEQESTLPPWVKSQVEAWQVRVWLAQGDLRPAVAWAAERGLGAEDQKTILPPAIDFIALFDYLVLARIRIEQKRLDEASDLLSRLLETAEAGGRMARTIEILLLQALVLHAGGDLTRAISRLKKAVALAEPEGFVRIFLDEGEPVARLLRKIVRRGMATNYAKRLLNAFSTAESVAEPERNVADPSALIEPLSERELEVLHHIAQGLTNQEIADRLYLSLNTIKVHTRNIYSKLDAHNRMQAVATARSLGILLRA